MVKEHTCTIAILLNLLKFVLCICSVTTWKECVFSACCVELDPVGWWCSSDLYIFADFLSSSSINCWEEYWSIEAAIMAVCVWTSLPDGSDHAEVWEHVPLTLCEFQLYERNHFECRENVSYFMTLKLPSSGPFFQSIFLTITRYILPPKFLIISLPGKPSMILYCPLN